MPQKPYQAGKTCRVGRLNPHFCVLNTLSQESTPTQQPANTIIWTPGERQYYGNPDQPYVHTWIHCDGRFIRMLLRTTQLPCENSTPFGSALPH